MNNQNEKYSLHTDLLMLKKNPNFKYCWLNKDIIQIVKRMFTYKLVNLLPISYI